MIPADWELINARGTKDLKGDALGEWHRVAPVLHKRGLLTESNVLTLCLYCRHHVGVLLLQRSVDEIEQQGNTNEGLRGALEEVRSMLKKFCADFFTPYDASGDRMDLSENLASFEKARLEKRPFSKGKSKVEEREEVVRSLFPLPKGVHREGLALDEWNRTAPRLKAMGNLENKNVFILAIYCEHFAGLIDCINDRQECANYGGDVDRFDSRLEWLKDSIESACEVFNVEHDENWRMIVD